MSKPCGRGSKRRSYRIALESQVQKKEDNNVNDLSRREHLKPVVSWKLEHVAIRVPDLEAAVAWYTEKPNFRLMNSSPLGDKIYGFMIAPAIKADFIIELIAGPGVELRPTYKDLASSLELPGLHHVAFRVRTWTTPSCS